MVLEIVVLSWFGVLFFMGVGRWVADNGDPDLMFGTIVALGLPALTAIASLIWG